MPWVKFVPAQLAVEVVEQTKILIAGRKAGVAVRFGCASCRCGTCAIKLLEPAQQLSPMKPDEEALLKKIKLPSDGSIRLACQARIIADCAIDLAFQDEYTPNYQAFSEED